MAKKQTWREKKKREAQIKSYGMKLFIFGCGVFFATVFQRIALLLIVTGLTLRLWYERKNFL